MKEYSNHGDELVKILFFIIVTFLGLSALIVKYQIWFMDFVSLITWVHLLPLTWVANILPSDLNFINSISIFFKPFQEIEFLLNPNSQMEISPSDWWIIQRKANQGIVLLYGIPLLIFMFNTWSVRPDLKFRRKYDIDSLWKLEIIKGSKPKFIRTIENNFQKSSSHSEKKKKPDCNNCNFNSGQTKHSIQNPIPSYASALTPEEWLITHNLVSPTPQSEEDDYQKFNQYFADKYWSHLTIDTIAEIFEDQLIIPWKGFQTLNSYERPLVAAFSLHHAFQHKKASDLLNRITVLFDRYFPNIERFQSALKSDRYISQEVRKALQLPSANALLKVANKHAWKYTAFIAMTKAARKESGVLSTSLFLWLKLVNRTLWYTLNNTGNAVASVEAAGVHAHYKAELQANMPLYCKRVFQVSRTLLHEYLGLNQEGIHRRYRNHRIRTPIGTKIKSLANHALQNPSSEYHQ